MATQFFRDTNGVLHAADRIVQIRPRWRPPGQTEWTPALVDFKDEYVSVHISEVELESLLHKLSPVLPAHEGFRVLAYFADEEGDWLDEYTVIGWRVDEYDDLHPMILDDMPSNAETAILEPTGKVRIPQVEDFEDRKAWEAAMRSRAKAKRGQS